MTSKAFAQCVIPIGIRKAPTLILLEGPLKHYYSALKEHPAHLQSTVLEQSGAPEQLQYIDDIIV